MIKIKSAVIAAAVLAFVALLGFVYASGHKEAKQEALGGTLNCQTDTCLTSLEITTGGLQIDAGGLSQGGATEIFTRSALNTGTTTVCAIQAPTAGTSTIQMFSATFTTSSTTASTVTMAKAATAFATTTSLGSAAIAANAQATVVASTTAATIIAPGAWLVVGMAGGTGTFSPVGSCTASFLSAY